MKNNGLRLLASFLLGLSVGSLSAQSSGQAPNANAIALLRWYPANLATQFSTGLKQPTGIAFDGQNMWVVGTGSDSVVKIRACDGEVLGTFKVGAAPLGVAFDGANI